MDLERYDCWARNEKKERPAVSSFNEHTYKTIPDVNERESNSAGVHQSSFGK